jgi:hypothetical protein
MNTSEEQDESPINNVIPVKKLKNGLFAAIGFVSVFIRSFMNI